MRILFVAAEANPFVKVGGLADVAGSLSRALRDLGHEVHLVMPLYGSIDREEYGINPTGLELNVRGREEDHTVAVWEARRTRVPAYLLDCPQFFAQGPVYGQPNDPDRFLAFCQAAAALVHALKVPPDVVHCHDWHAALVPAFLHGDGAERPRPATVLTIHNLAYQGAFDYAWATAAGVAPYIPGKEDPLHPLLWRFLGLGMYHADALSTVSETYAREVLTPEYGEGLEPLLRHRQGDLFGILNGLDEDEFDPARDSAIRAPYRAKTISRKAENKRDLQAAFGLPQEPHTPLLGNVGRLVEQKGVGLLVEAMDAFLRQGEALQAVLLGTGERAREQEVQELARRYPNNVGVRIGFDNALAHKMYAGCDLFLMPSRFEPCGLGQLIAMKYGTVPVVRRTGGLADTVREDPVSGTGFVFEEFDASALVAALERALSLYRNSEGWAPLVQRAMHQDFSWKTSVGQYLRLYQHALSHRDREQDRGTGDSPH